MRANLDITNGTIVSEAVMMGLGPHLGRQRAHDLVYDICRESAAKGKPLVDLLAADKEISARHARRAGEDVRSGELSRLGRRDGRSGAGDREGAVVLRSLLSSPRRRGPILRGQAMGHGSC